MSETPEALKLKIAKLEGKIQMLEESNTKLSQENAALNNKMGTLDNQLVKEKKFKLVLSVRSRIEFLEEFLGVPWTDFRTGKSITHREERWLTYFDVKKDDVLAMELKRRVKDGGSTIEVFCRSISVLYGDFSDRAAHRVPLPPEVTDEDIDKFLQQIGVYNDKPVKIAVKVLIQPLDGEPTIISSSSSEIELSLDIG